MTTAMDGQVALRQRVRSAADSVEELAEALKIARERRDELIVEALDGGHSTREVARWARVSQTRVGKILSQH